QAATLALDRDARLRLGLDIEDIVSGTIDAQVRSLPDGRGEHYELDPRRARLVLPGLGWSKGVGVPATMRFDLVPADIGARAENVVLDGDGFGFSGTAEIGREHGLVGASLKRFRLHPGDDVAVEIAYRDGAYGVKVEGAAFDVRGVIAEVRGDTDGDDGGGAADISVEAKVRKLRGYNGRVLGDAAVLFVAKAGVPRKLTVNGRLEGG